MSLHIIILQLCTSSNPFHLLCYCGDTFYIYICLNSIIHYFCYIIHYFLKRLKVRGKSLTFTIWGILPSFACIHISIWYPFPLALQYFLQYRSANNELFQLLNVKNGTCLLCSFEWFFWIASSHTYVDQYSVGDLKRSSFSSLEVSLHSFFSLPLF